MRCPWALEGPCPTTIGPWVGLECSEMGPCTQTTCPWVGPGWQAMTLGWEDHHHPEIVMRFTDLTKKKKKKSVVDSSYVTYEQTTLTNIFFPSNHNVTCRYCHLTIFSPLHMNRLCRLGMHLLFRSRNFLKFVCILFFLIFDFHTLT